MERIVFFQCCAVFAVENYPKVSDVLSENPMLSRISYAWYLQGFKRKKCELFKTSATYTHILYLLFAHLLKIPFESDVLWAYENILKWYLLFSYVVKLLINSKTSLRDCGCARWILSDNALFYVLLLCQRVPSTCTCYFDNKMCSSYMEVITH